MPQDNDKENDALDELAEIASKEFEKPRFSLDLLAQRTYRCEVCGGINNLVDFAHCQHCGA
jgi:hypothetical protein